MTPSPLPCHRRIRPAEVLDALTRLGARLTTGVDNDRQGGLCPLTAAAKVLGYAGYDGMISDATLSSYYVNGYLRAYDRRDCAVVPPNPMQRRFYEYGERDGEDMRRYFVEGMEPTRTPPATPTPPTRREAQ